MAKSLEAVCLARVRRWLGLLCRENGVLSVRRRDDCLGVEVSLGSAVAVISVWPCKDQPGETVINIQSSVVSGLEDVPPDLALWLLRQNHLRSFGAFGLDKSNRVVFEDTLVGSTCNSKEFYASLFAVLTMADKFDDRIISRYGGVRASECLEERA